MIDVNIKDKKLVIVLDEIDGTPQVFIDGEEIKIKQSIKLDWKTADDEHDGVVDFEVNYTKPNKSLINAVQDVEEKRNGILLLDIEDRFIKLTDKIERTGFRGDVVEHVRYEELTNVEGNTTSYVKSKTLLDLYYESERSKVR